MKETFNKFEDYLQELFAKNYTGLDDDMPDRYEHWVENLDVDDLIAFADEYGQIKFLQGNNEAIANLTDK